MTPYAEALHTCGVRYRPMAMSLPNHQWLVEFIDQFLEGCKNGLPERKLCRWLGFIQGVLIIKDVTGIEDERDWTRPLFRPLDFPDVDIG